jgi:hypothetical protein
MRESCRDRAGDCALPPDPLVAGTPDVERVPRRSGNASISLGASSDDVLGLEPPCVARVAGVPYRSPGAAFLDSILSMFCTMVASPVGGTCELNRF